MVASLISSLGPLRGYEVLDFLLVFLCVLAASLLLVVVVLAVRRSSERARHGRNAEALGAGLLGRLDLDALDLEIIQRLDGGAPPAEPRYSFLTDPGVYDSIAAELDRSGACDAEDLRRLRGKLGLAYAWETQTPAGTEELPVGLPVQLTQPGGYRSLGTVRGVSPEGIAVGVDPGGSQARAGYPVMVYFQNRAGFFSFPSTVVSSQAEELRLEHSPRIYPCQRRKYPRRERRLAIFVKPQGGDTGVRESRILELSGGGATLENPDRRFACQDLLELSFSERERRHALRAQVVRTSRAGSLLHVQFLSLLRSPRGAPSG